MALLLSQARLIVLSALLQALPLEEDFAASLEGWTVVAPEPQAKLTPSGGLVIEACEEEHAYLRRPFSFDGTDRRPLVIEASCATDGAGCRGRFAPRMALAWGDGGWAGLGPDERSGSVSVWIERGGEPEERTFGLRARDKFLCFYRAVLTSKRIWFFFSGDGLEWSLACRVPRAGAFAERPSGLVVGKGPGTGKAGSGKKARCVFGRVRAYVAGELAPAEIEKHDDWDSTRRALATGPGPFLTDWLILGPFDNKENKGFWGAGPAEKAFSPEAEYEGLKRTVSWRKLAAEEVRDGWLIDLDRAVDGAKWSYAYARAEIDSPSAADALLLLGTDDCGVAWLNGTRVFHADVWRGVSKDQDRAACTFRPGANVLLLKVTQGGGAFGFCARVAGAQTAPARARRLLALLELFPQDARATAARLELAKAFEGALRFDQARGVLEEAASGETADYALLELVRLSSLLGDEIRAERAAGRLRGMSDSPRTAFALARASDERGARAELERVLGMESAGADDRRRARLLLSLIERRSGNTDAAVRALRSAAEGSRGPPAFAARAEAARLLLSADRKDEAGRIADEIARVHSLSSGAAAAQTRLVEMAAALAWGGEMPWKPARPAGKDWDTSLRAMREGNPRECVGEWRVCGVLPNSGGRGFAEEFPPEKAQAPEAFRHEGKSYEWKEHAEKRRGEVNLGRTYGDRGPGVVYAYWACPEDAPEGDILFGDDCPSSVWVDGRKVYANPLGDGSFEMDEHRIRARLRGGSKVLIKFAASRVDRLRFYFRIGKTTWRELDIEEQSGLALAYPLHSKAPGAWRTVALNLAAQGRDSDARKAAEVLSLAYPDLVAERLRAYRELAGVFRNRKEHAESAWASLRAFECAHERDDRSLCGQALDALIEGAEDCFRAGRPAEALSALEKAWEWSPGHPKAADAALRRAAYHRDAGHKEEALEGYGFARSLWGHLERVRTEVEKGTARARKFRGGMVVVEDSFEAKRLVERGTWKLRRARPEEAGMHLRELARNCIGEVFDARGGLYIGVSRALKAILLSQPADSPVWEGFLGEGRKRARTGLLGGGALLGFARAHPATPEERSAFVRAGDLARDRGRFAEALELYDRSRESPFASREEIARTSEKMLATRASVEEVAARPPATGALARRLRHLCSPRGSWGPPRESGGRVVYRAANRLTALDAATGEVLWSHRFASALRREDLSVETRGGRAFSLSGPSSLSAVDVSTGRLLWETGLDGAEFASSPSVGYDRAYAVALRKGELDSSYLVCLDAGTGRVEWQTFLSSGPSGIHSPAPIAAHGAVYCMNNLGTASAVDALTGDRLWVRVYPRREPEGDGSLALAGEAFVVSPADGRGLYAYSEDGGDLLWKDEVSPQRRLAEGGKDELVAWGPGGARGLDPGSGELRWTVERELLGAPAWGPPPIMPSREGVTAADGETLVAEPWPYVRATPAGLLVSKPGEIACYSPAEAAPHKSVLLDDEGLSPAGGGLSSLAREAPEAEAAELSFPAHQCWEMRGRFKWLLPRERGRIIVVDDLGARLVQDGLPPATVWRFECGFEPHGMKLSGERLLLWGGKKWCLNDAKSGKPLAAGELPGGGSWQDVSIRHGDAGPGHLAVTQRYSLSVLDLSGKELWRRSVREAAGLFFARGSLWLLESRHRDTKLIAFKPEDGSVLWTEKLTDQYGWFHVHVHGDAAHIVPGGGGESFRVDLDSKDRKTFKVESIREAPRFTRKGDLFFFSGKQAYNRWWMQCFDGGLETLYSAAARLWDSDGHKLVVAEAEKLRFLDARTRKELWSLPGKTDGMRLLKIAGEHVFVLDGSGVVRALSCADGGEKWRGRAPADATECIPFGGSLVFRTPGALVGLREGDPEPVSVHPSERVRGVVRAESCERSRPRLLAFRRGAEAKCEETLLGSEGEWVSSPLGLAEERGWGGPGDVRGAFSASWDERSLRVRLRVHDDCLDPLGDGAELFLGWRDRTVVRRFSFDGPWRLLPDGGGWEHEFVVDWYELIGDERPRPWLDPRMSLRVHDSDGLGREGYVEWGSPRSQASWGELVLVGLSAEVEARYWRAMELLPSAPEARRLFVDIVKNLPGREKKGRAERFLRAALGTANERFARAWLELAGGPKAGGRAELRQEVFLDRSSGPREVMIEFFDGSSWEHRAFWGRDELGYGERGTPSRLRVGDLPEGGSWVELSVRPEALELNRIQGVSFRARGGKAFWGRTRLVTDAGETLLVDGSLPKDAKAQGKFGWQETSGKRAHAADEGHSFTWEGVVLGRPADAGISALLFTRLREASRILADDDAGRAILHRLVSFIRGAESAEKVRAEYEAFVRARPRERNVVAALEALSRVYSQAGAAEPLDECARLIASAGVRVSLAREFWRKFSPPSRDFFLLGPYDNEGNKARKTAFAPEKGQLDLGGAKRPYESSPEGYFDLDGIFRKDWYCAYAFTRAYSPGRRAVRLYFGADEGVQIWVNGNSVAGPMDSRAQLDLHSARVVLRPGWNDVLIKVWDARYGSGFYFRIADLNGRPYADVRLDPEGGR